MLCIGAGPLPPIDTSDALKIFEAFSYDKKTIDGSLQWILLQGIGEPVIVPQKDIPRSVSTVRKTHFHTSGRQKSHRFRYQEFRDMTNPKYNRSVRTRKRRAQIFDGARRPRAHCQCGI